MPRLLSTVKGRRGVRAYAFLNFKLTEFMQ